MNRRVLLFLFAGIAAAQQPAFDIASVRLTQHGRAANGVSRSETSYRGHGRFEAVNGSLEELIRYAYSVREYQIIGPSWLNSDEASYDIEAKAPPETTEREAALMLRKLLADRFKLSLHRETRIYPVYDLLPKGKSLRMTQSKAGSRTRMGSGGGQLTASGESMAGFANWLSRETERPVFDKTGIEGAFDFTLRYALRNDLNPEAPSIFTALQELGLKLESTKGPVEVLVIDHVEKIPTEN